MHYPAIVKAQNLILAGDIVGAESALVELADEEGDHALVLALDQLPPKDLLAVIREYDPSKDSVINLLVTPEQFSRAVVIEKQYKDLTHAHLRGMMNSVIFRDDNDPVEFLRAIGEREGGCDALADYLADHWGRVESFLRTGTFEASEDTGAVLSEAELVVQMYHDAKVDQDEIADHDWMEFTWLLRAHCPDILIEVMVILRARVKAYEQEAEGEEEDGHHQGGHTPFRETHGEGEGSQKKAIDPDEESAI
ncbi:hypothetical protein SAMN05216303_101264 [Rhodoferax sp. OV413]|uniref:hypothetical protein n=1 Tax=Rhodoferax sp. OV413 TaxID=1855285 RepID=UPI000887B041|nr:hypothetical protein [Rhodoferax sp. OV413]SDO00825.1 hypothetical protein SAMN05216303_101264 [Rhodoferax sp. OV413]